MHGRLQLISLLSLFSFASFATLPDSSNCRVFIDDNARGIVFPNGALGLGMIAPAEVVSVIAAICSNPERDEKTLFVASHAAYFEKDELFSDPGYGIFAPTYNIVQISLADMHFGETSSHADVTEKDRVSRTMQVALEHNNHDIFTLKQLTLNVTVTFPLAEGNSMIRLGSPSSPQQLVISKQVSHNADGVAITSTSIASNLIDHGSFTYGQIENFMKHRRFTLSRATRK